MGSPHLTVTTAQRGECCCQHPLPTGEEAESLRGREEAEKALEHTHRLPWKLVCKRFSWRQGPLQLRLLGSQAAKDAHTFPSRDKGPLKSDTQLLNGICQGCSTLLPAAVSGRDFPQADTIH